MKNAGGPPSFSSNSSSGGSGGLRGFFQRAGHSFSQWSNFAWNQGHVWSQRGVKLFIAVASTSAVTLLPLLFEISREVQMLETERALVKDYRNRGYSDRQLQEMGYSESSILGPSAVISGLQKV